MLAKYRLNTTKYVLKWPKKHQSAKIKQKKPYPHCPTHPPRAYPLCQINNIPNKDNLPVFFKPFPYRAKIVSSGKSLPFKLAGTIRHNWELCCLTH